MVARLAMIRFKATGEKIGSLIVNPGGPGESGVSAATSMLGLLPDNVRQRFDLVGFDPRGVAASTPAVWCNSDADNDRLRADPSWVVHDLDETHNVLRHGPDALLGVLGPIIGR